MVKHGESRWGRYFDAHDSIPPLVVSPRFDGRALLSGSSCQDLSVMIMTGWPVSSCSEKGWECGGVW